MCFDVLGGLGERGERNSKREQTRQRNGAETGIGRRRIS
jgi:hypothetical protein